MSILHGTIGGALTYSPQPPPPSGPNYWGPVQIGVPALPPLTQRPIARAPQARDLFLESFALFGSRWIPAMFLGLIVGLIEVLSLIWPTEGIGSGLTQVVAICAAVAIASASMVAQLSMQRLFVAAAFGENPTVGAVVLGTLRRLPFVIGWMLAAVAVFGLAFAQLLLLGYLEPATLVFTVPLVVIAIIAGSPYFFVFSTMTLSGPTSNLLANVATSTTGRWWYIFRCTIILGFAPFLTSMIASMIALIGWIIGGPAPYVAAVIGFAAQCAVSAAGTAAAHKQLDFPVDPELVARSGTSAVATTPPPPTANLPFTTGN